jgi:uncharacterized protein
MSQIPAEFQLSELEARVLGVMMEKQVTVPDSYPMTVNSVRLGSNQKNSRFPITEYSEKDIAVTLERLGDRRLVTIVREYNARAPKYSQLLTRELKLEPQHTAILTVLMLRGPQTPGELRGRAEAMFKFSGLEHAEQVLNQLCEWIPDSLAVKLEKLPGERDARFVHLLTDPEVQREARPASAAGAPVSGGTLERVEALEAEVRSLRERIERLERREES